MIRHINIKSLPKMWTTAPICMTRSNSCSKHVPNDDGKVGIWGISYPGFYTSSSIIDSHPALKAASPQAPMTDLFFSDNGYHGGAFMSPRILVSTYSLRGLPNLQRHPNLQRNLILARQMVTPSICKPDLPVSWKRNINGSNPLFTDQLRHTTYDDYSKARDISRHMKKC